MLEMVCRGFQFSGIASGIKKNKDKDLGLIYSESVAKVAGAFTQNQVVAPCVTINKKLISQSGRCQAVIVNSGNANCCTGERGISDVRAVSECLAKSLNISTEHILTASTGVIGNFLPVNKIEQAMPELINELDSKGMSSFSTAILTTDLVDKTVSITGSIDGKTFTVMGVAKGSGMIHPNMATMLCFICTDADVSSACLHKCLQSSVTKSFNRVTVDGDTSTNDMVLLMANGMSDAIVKDQEHEVIFQDILDKVMLDLAKMIVKDGEGATKFVEVEVCGAESKQDAFKIAQTVATSNLVKTALFGEDANWGRIFAAAGRSGVLFDANKVDICFDDVLIVNHGLKCADPAEEKATQVLKKEEFKIIINLNAGSEKESVFTCDFSYDYVKINADYRS